MGMNDSTELVLMAKPILAEVIRRLHDAQNLTPWREDVDELEILIDKLERTMKVNDRSEIIVGGADPNGALVKCSRCDGSGTGIDSRNECYYCGGTGKRYKCPICGDEMEANEFGTGPRWYHECKYGCSECNGPRTIGTPYYYKGGWQEAAIAGMNRETPGA